jgi:hypothetical protein
MKASFAAIFRRGGCKAELFGTTAAGGGGGAPAGGGGDNKGSGGSGTAEPTTADALIVSRKLDELCAAWAQPRGG